MARKLVKDGVDPIEHRESERKARAAAEALERARSMTFRQCAEAYVAAHKSGWKNAKHAAQWPSTLKMYCYPAYRRGDLFDKRRRLMDDWAVYCGTLPAELGAAVVPLRRAAG